MNLPSYDETFRGVVTMTRDDAAAILPQRGYGAGYYEGRLAMALHNGAWVQRAKLPGDRPISESPEAKAAQDRLASDTRARYFPNG